MHFLNPFLSVNTDSTASTMIFLWCISLISLHLFNARTISKRWNNFNPTDKFQHKNTKSVLFKNEVTYCDRELHSKKTLLQTMQMAVQRRRNINDIT